MLQSLQICNVTLPHCTLKSDFNAEQVCSDIGIALNQPECIKFLDSNNDMIGGKEVYQLHRECLRSVSTVNMFVKDEVLDEFFAVCCALHCHVVVASTKAGKPISAAENVVGMLLE